MNKREPKLARELLAPPEHLSDMAREAWGYMAALLHDIGVSTRADRAALEELCEAYAQVRVCRAVLADLGSLTYETVSAAGGISHRAYPEVAILSDADRRLQTWLAKFGLTPADRTRVSAAETSEANPFAALA